jgi:hypothetical protein
MTAAASDSRSSWTLTDWEHRLRGEPGPPPRRFTDAELEGLEEQVRRHLAHAIAAGTPLTWTASVLLRPSDDGSTGQAKAGTAMLSA